MLTSVNDGETRNVAVCIVFNFKPHILINYSERLVYEFLTLYRNLLGTVGWYYLCE